MRLIHYSDREVNLKPMDYDQSLLSWQAKPNGLWLSVEGPYDWKNWCEGEGFRIENLVVSYEIKLKEDSKILYLQTEKEVYNMAIRFPLKSRTWDQEIDSYCLNWPEVKKKYQGIIIPQYQWECRLSQQSCWYYGWDCACGCIWDLSCIEEFKLLESNENH